MSDQADIDMEAAWEMAHADCMVQLTRIEYENLMNDRYWAKQDKIDSAANARAAKTLNKVDRAVEVRKFNKANRGRLSTSDIIKRVKQRWGIGKTTYYEDISGAY